MSGKSTASSLVLSASKLSPKEIARDLSCGRLNAVIESISTRALGGVARELKLIRQQFELEANYRLAAKVDLVRDRVTDEQKIRAKAN